MISNFSVNTVRCLLTVDSEMASFLCSSLPEVLYVFFQNSCDSRKINCLICEFDSKFRWKKPTSHSSLRDSCDIGFPGEIYCGIHYFNAEKGCLENQNSE